MSEDESIRGKDVPWCRNLALARWVGTIFYETESAPVVSETNEVG